MDERQDILIVDDSGSATVAHTVEIIEVDEDAALAIDTEEAFAPVGVTNENLRHTLLTERDVTDQHPIRAITGLQNELDNIKALKTVYSDSMGTANYYQWSSGEYDEAGYFVSLVPNTSTITLCAGADIFGVTVASAGFVGNQDKDVWRDNSYALVVTTGLVGVRCESDVVAGDYVISNAYGMAEKTDTNCGYKVVAVENKKGTLYAVIALGVQACTTDILGQRMQRLEADLDDAETNIVAAMNAANDAYNKAAESSAISEDALREALEALDKADTAVNTTTQTNDILASVSATAEQAKAIAGIAISTAITAKDEAVAASKDALTNVNNLTEKLTPITEWEDPVTKNVGAEYFTTYIQDGVATKVDIQTVERLTQDNKSAITKSAEEFSSFISSVDKYSVGEYSQAYGLTSKQAQDILTKGMIYVPTVQHSEVTFNEGFLRNASYEWEGEKWKEDVLSVSFASLSVPTGGAFRYWYTESGNMAPQGYEPHTLYMWHNDTWTKVATLAGNVNNRITSLIRQDVDEVRAEVVNAYGAVAGFGAKLTDTDSKVNSIASWPTDGGTHNMAVLEQKADSSGSYMVLAAVTDVGGKPKVTELGGAKIVLNDSTLGSYIQMDADRIAFTADDYAAIAQHIQLDAVYMGVSNIIPNSRGNDLTGWSTENYSVTAEGYSVATDDDKEYCFMASNSSTSTTSSIRAVSPRTPPVMPGSTYTLSFDVYVNQYARRMAVRWAYDTSKNKKTGSAYVGLSTLLDGAPSEIGVQVNTWTRLSYSFDMAADAYTGLLMFDHYGTTTSGQAAVIKIANIQLERGSVATDWKPYNEDLATNSSLARIEQTATANSANIGLLVQNGQASGRLIIEAINGEGSSATIEADKINLAGVTDFVRPGDLSGKNKTTIDGSNITTGIIQSRGYTDTHSTVYSTKGTCFDLDKGNIHSQNFAIVNGSAYFNGEITAQSGYIGTSNERWQIDANGFEYTTNTADNSQYWTTHLRPHDFLYRSFRDYVQISRTSQSEYLCGFKFEVSVGQENPTTLTLERDTDGIWGGVLRGEWTFSANGMGNNTITMQDLIDAVNYFKENKNE